MSGRPAAILDRLFDVVLSRKRERPPGSYVVSLLDGGVPAAGAKVREEAHELVEAAASGDRAHSAREAADLLFHVWVLLACAELTPNDVYAELEKRFGTSGLAEKAARSKPSGGAGAC